ncbi:MAG: hypothetical protein L0H73_00440 [Nitrococcus sp.]|nr:hypothetical protein [Nitrococcus sp.]
MALSSGQGFAAERDTSRNPFAAIEVVPSQDLATMRGRAGDLTIITNRQEVRSSVNNVQIMAGTVHTGAITVGEGALSGSGLSINNFITGNGNSTAVAAAVIVNMH